MKNPGFYYYTGTEWVYPSYFVGNSTAFNILDAIADPANPSKFFLPIIITAPGYGIYKMKYNAGSKDFEFVKRYPLDAANQFLNRPVGFAYDDQNNMFASIGILQELADLFLLLLIMTEQPTTF